MHPEIMDKAVLAPSLQNATQKLFQEFYEQALDEKPEDESQDTHRGWYWLGGVAFDLELPCKPVDHHWPVVNLIVTSPVDDMESDKQVLVTHAELDGQFFLVRWDHTRPEYSDDDYEATLDVTFTPVSKYPTADEVMNLIRFDVRAHPSSVRFFEHGAAETLARDLSHAVLMEEISEVTARLGAISERIEDFQ